MYGSTVNFQLKILDFTQCAIVIENFPVDQADSPHITINISTTGSGNLEVNKTAMFKIQIIILDRYNLNLTRANSSLRTL